METSQKLSDGFKDTFMEKVMDILESGKFVDVNTPINNSETIIGTMSDLEKSIWTYMQSLIDVDPLTTLRNSPKNTDGCVLDTWCLLLVDNESECHFDKELREIRNHYEENKNEILKNRELHKKAFSFMIGLIEDRLNVELKRVGVRSGFQIVLVN